MQQNIPIYTMGSADPRFIANKSTKRLTLWQRIKYLFFKKPLIQENPNSYQYTAFSGIDIKTRLHLKDGSVDSIPGLQSFSISSNNDIAYCDLIFVIFDRSILPIIKNTQDIIFEAANEYGTVAHCYLKNISFESYDSNISIDDLVSEETISISANGFSPWTKFVKNKDMFIEEIIYKWMKPSNKEIAERIYPKEFRDKYFKE